VGSLAIQPVLPPGDCTYRNPSKVPSTDTSVPACTASIIGALSLGGIPILAGFWSKDEILLAVNEHLHPVFIVLTLLTALLSALYMARAMFLVFFGASRATHSQVHDAPLTMAGTMSLLGILALLFGLITLNWPGAFDGFGSFLFFQEPESFHFEPWLGILSILLATAAFVGAYLVYSKKSIALEGMRRSLSPVLRVVENKYYVDEFYQWIVDHIVLVVASFVGFFDRAVVNDIAVNVPANAVRHLGFALRLHVTGHVYSYALGMVLGAIGLAIVWWVQSV